MAAFFELRQYRIKDGKRDRWVRWMEEQVIPFQVERGMTIVGSWIDQEQPDRYVWMRRFESEEQHAALRKAIYEDRQWKAEFTNSDQTRSSSEREIRKAGCRSHSRNVPVKVSRVARLRWIPASPEPRSSARTNGENRSLRPNTPSARSTLSTKRVTETRSSARSRSAPAASCTARRPCSGARAPSPRAAVRRWPARRLSALAPPRKPRRVSLWRGERRHRWRPQLLQKPIGVRQDDRWPDAVARRRADRERARASSAVQWCCPSKMWPRMGR